MSTKLLLREVVLAQLLPQMPVLAEHGQCWGHLTQGDDVPPIREPVQDVAEHVHRKVTERQATVHLLGHLEILKLLLPVENGF